MSQIRWMIYWNEYASDTYLYGSRVIFHKRDDVEFCNALIPPGTVIKRWYSKTDFRKQKIEPSLPMIDGESTYRITVNVSGREQLLFRMVFFDRYEQEVGDLILRDKVTEFKCPLKTYSYQIELIHGGTTQFHFHSMMIEELVWDKKES